MKLLVLAPEPVDAAAVRGALPDENLDDAEVMVVSPALNDSPVRFWTSDSDEAIDRADAVRAESVDALRDDGVRARGTTGEGEPLQALQDALATFPADRILVFVHPRDEQRYREDDLMGEAKRRFGVPVEQRVLGS